MEQQRQLAAIMFTDIVGYTRLMGSSEQKALDVLQQNRAIQKPLIEQFNGTFIKELGDGTMASFPKSTDAVRCAMAIQKASAEHPDLNLRIGIHLGEVVFEDGDVFGDGVNVAARIESAATTGSVYISDPVNTTVRNKDDIETRFIEQMQLKNVNRPIDIYEVAVDGKFTDADPKSKRTKPSNIGKFVGMGVAIALALAVVFWFALGDKGASKKQLDHASIAVLPFTNMSTNADNEIFCDGVTEDILTQLSKLKNLKVISRTSVMHFKGSDLTLPEIAEQLGVEYIVEGSVRREGDQVAITAQLIHAETDGHLWADNFDRSLENVFAIQREVAQQIAQTLNIKISQKEREGMSKSMTENVEAYQEYLLGLKASNMREEPGVKRAIQHFEKAIELDPLFADAHAQLGFHIGLLRKYGADTDSVLGVWASRIDLAKQIDSNRSVVRALEATLYESQYWRHRPIKMSLLKRAAKTAELAIELDPNNAYAYRTLAMTKESGDEKLRLLKIAVELDPFHAVINDNLVSELIDQERYDEAEQYISEHRSILTPLLLIMFKADIANGRKDWQEAMTARRDLLKERPYNDHWWAYLALYHLGVHKDADSALAVLSKIPADNKPNILRHVAIVRIYAYKDDLEGAWDYLNAIEFDDDHRFFSLKGEVLYYQGRYEEALAAFEQKPVPSAFKYASLVKLGDEALAIAYMDTLSGNWPDHQKAVIHAAMGNVDSSLFYLDRLNKPFIYSDLGGILWSRVEPIFEEVRKDPGYAKIEEKWKLP